MTPAHPTGETITLTTKSWLGIKSRENVKTLLSTAALVLRLY